MYLCMYQEACFPSFTDSTVVLARPPTSPPAKTQGSLVCIVSRSTSGRPHLLNLIGAMASLTAIKVEDKYVKRRKKTLLLESVRYTLITIRKAVPSSLTYLNVNLQ